VLIGGAMATGLVPEEVGAAALVVTTVTMIMIPALAAVGRRLKLRATAGAQATAKAEPWPQRVENRVIVAGFGRVGRQVGEMLERHKIPYLALDSDAARVAEQRRAGAAGLFRRQRQHRDAAPLRHRHGPGAVSSPSTIPAPSRRRWRRPAPSGPDLTIVARARDARHASSLYELGVDDAGAGDDRGVAAAVGGRAGRCRRVPMGLVIASIHERRDEYRALLKKR
jgi:CPA2 family monovalent cation:H+ antiporter-2